MKKVHVQRYSASLKEVWDTFVSNAEVHSILFYRDFMEYHSDRFQDYSLLVFQENKPIAIFPANIDSEGIVHSHQGLSYGGVLFATHTYFETHIYAYTAILEYLNQNSIDEITIKSIPKCYKTNSADTLVFDWLDANTFRVDAYSYIPKALYEKPNKDRSKYLKKASKLDLIVEESSDFSGFWQNLLIPNLNKRFGVAPVHTIEEIIRLSLLFPDQIRLFQITHKKKVRAGIVLFYHRDVAHAQYIAGDEGRSDGSLDYLIDFVIKKVNPAKTFSFGTSSENQGKQVNGGLLYWKESFRAVHDVQQFFRIKTANHTALMNRLR